MGQITIYMDDVSLKKIEAAAKKEHDSVSRWVKKRLLSSLESGWPKDYFDVFGSIKDPAFKRYDQGKWADDAKRQEI